MDRFQIPLRHHSVDIVIELVSPNKTDQQPVMFLRECRFRSLDFLSVITVHTSVWNWQPFAYLISGTTRSVHDMARSSERISMGASWDIIPQIIPKTDIPPIKTMVLMIVMRTGFGMDFILFTSEIWIDSKKRSSPVRMRIVSCSSGTAIMARLYLHNASFKYPNYWLFLFHAMQKRHIKAIDRIQ